MVCLRATRGPAAGEHADPLLGALPSPSPRVALPLVRHRAGAPGRDVGGKGINQHGEAGPDVAVMLVHRATPVAPQVDKPPHALGCRPHGEDCFRLIDDNLVDRLGLGCRFMRGAPPG